MHKINFINGTLFTTNIEVKKYTTFKILFFNNINENFSNFLLLIKLLTEKLAN